MTLIRSISGIRGTIGGQPGEGLSPLDVVRYTAAFGQLMKNQAAKKHPRAVIGRDARPSGPMVADLVRATLVGLGYEVVDLGPATTPTVEMAVVGEQADAGIIITASHNPEQWNALKLLNGQGEFISAAQAAGRDFTVDWVHLKLNDQAQRTVLCKDPFRSVDERVKRLIASM